MIRDGGRAAFFRVRSGSWFQLYIGFKWSQVMLYNIPYIQKS